MDSVLFTSWSDYRNAVTSVLAQATVELLILDPDLEHLPLEDATSAARLAQLLSNPQARLRLALLDAGRLRDHSPRLMALLRQYSQRMEVIELPAYLQSLRDCLLIADGRHVAVRFDRDQPRGKICCDDANTVTPYRQRFESAWQEGGIPISATTLGL